MKNICACTVFTIVCVLALPAAVLSQVEGRFTLGPGDVLEISVWGDESLHKDVVVRPDGKISFPLIGDVSAQGGTVEELRGQIKDRISEYVPDAPVSVMLLKLGSQRVYVVGKVNKPGMYVMEGPLRVMQVLAMAGGMTPFADSGKIKIVRTTVSGQEMIPFDYDDLAKGRSVASNIPLHPGDTIVVP